MLLEILCLDGNLLKFASQRLQTDREIAPGRSWGVLYWYHSIHVCCTYIVVFRYSRTVEVYKLCQFHKMSSSWGTSSSAACRGSLAICFWRVSQSKIWRNDTRSKAMGSMYGTQFCCFFSRLKSQVPTVCGCDRWGCTSECWSVALWPPTRSYLGTWRFWSL